ncbi:MAG TPA: DUF2804 family protein [Thermoleophilaceae bacterium]|nr:DUF2804 family protein [Thermoleophilaceae bacterium]
MGSLPVRGEGVRELGLPLPPARMPLVRDRRPLKRWRYVGVYGPELMLCVGDARVGGLPQRWWAVALPDGFLRERTTSRRGGVTLAPGRARVAVRGVRIELELDEGPGFEVVSPHASSYIWTRKQVAPARGLVELDGTRFEIDGPAFVDESAGYHARHTSWRWSAGVGRGEGGEEVAWNLVEGVHDAPETSERTVWVNGEPTEVGPVEFAPDLTRLGADPALPGGLRFSEWSAREHRARRGYFRSEYRQPFGTFEGELPNGTRLAAGWGVMEWHDARW